MATCKECIHCDICEKDETLTEFDKNQTAYCKGFKNKADVVEVVHGELKGIHYFGWNCWYGFCSICGIEHRGISKIDLIYGHKYCHNCGAKMDGTPKERGGEK